MRGFSVLTWGIGAPALLVGLIEAIPAASQWLNFLLNNLLYGMLSGKPFTGFTEVAREFPAFSIFKFHGLPSGLASPLFLIIGGAAIALAMKLANVDRRRPKMSLFSFLKRPKKRAVETPAAMEAVVCEKILNESRARTYVTIERCQPVEYYENTFLSPMPKSWQMDIFEYPSLLRACLSDIEVTFLDSDDKVCDYCNARYNFVDTNPLILLTAFPYTIFKVPPADASDLKVVFREGWIGHVQAPGYSFNCSKCGHRLHFKTEHWWQGSRDSKQHGTIPRGFPGRRIA